MVKSIFAVSLFFLSCSYALAQEDTIRFTSPQKLTDQVNSSAEESLPLLSADGSKLYIARTFHPDNKGGKYSGQDIWQSTLSNGEFSSSEPLGELNDEWSNVVVGSSADGKRLYLLNESSTELEAIPGLSVSTFDASSDSWGIPSPVEIPELEVKSGFYGIFVDPNEEFILWSLPTSEEDSLGNDLYVSLNSDGAWGAPQSLGATINTDANEISPYYDPVTDLLFFSSNSLSDAMNYDIRYAKKTGEGWDDWSEPKNADFNSNSFDAYFFMTSDSTGYFSSNRNDSLSNIYITDVIIESPSLEDQEDSTSVPKDIEVIVETDGKESKDRGILSISKEELLDEETVIRFIYFEYDKYNITAKYVEVLDDVATILDTYQDLYVKIEGHTDAIASDAYNQILSDNRAYSAKEWLVINGIDPDRVKTEGFGEREPYASNATEDGRAKNRRVEIFFREMK